MADDHDSIEDISRRRQEQQEERDRQPSLLSLEVRQIPGLEDPLLVGSVKLKGELPIRKDLHTGEELTVQVCGPDGEVLASGLFEVGLPAFKPVKMKGVGVIGTERAHTATFLPGE